MIQPGICIATNPLRVVCIARKDGELFAWEYELTTDQADSMAGGLMTAADAERVSVAAKDAEFLAASRIAGLEVR